MPPPGERPDLMVVIAYGLLLPRDVARLAAAGLHQPARVAAAALARRGADPTRRARRRRRDRHQRHANGRRPRHGARAPRARDADRRARNGRRAPRSPRRSRGAGVARGAARDAARHLRRRAAARRARDARAEDREEPKPLLDWREPAVAARTARARVRPLARRRSALERRPAPARVRSDGRRGPRRPRAARHDRRRRARRHRRRDAATACCVCAESSRLRAARWTPRRISRRIRCREWRLSPEPRRPAPRCAPSRLGSSRECSTSASPADELLPAAGVSARDQPLLAALVLGALRWHYRLEWQAQRLAHAAARARPGARSRRCCASVCCSCRSCASRSTRRCLRRSMPRRCSALRSARGLVNAVLRRFQREREQLEQAALRGRRGAIRASALAHRRDPRRPSARLAGGPRRQQRGAAAVAARESAAHDARAPISRSSRRPGSPRSPHRTSSPPCSSSSPSAWSRCRGSPTGEVSVQDLSAQHAAPLLELDARAARARRVRGARRQDRAHSRGDAGGRGEVWAVDRDAARARARARKPRAARLGGQARHGRRDGAAGLVGRPAVRPDSHRRAVQRDRRDSPPSRHQGAAPAGRRRARRSRSRRACSGAVAAARARAAGSSTRPARFCERENDAQIAAFRAAGAGDRGRRTAWRRCNYCPRRRAAMASIMLGCGSRTCCECPVDLLRDDSPARDGSGAPALAGSGHRVCRHRRHARSGRALASRSSRRRRRSWSRSRTIPGSSRFGRPSPSCATASTYLNAVIAYRLSTEASDALHSGVPLGIRLDVEIIHPRRWWFDNDERRAAAVVPARIPRAQRALHRAQRQQRRSGLVRLVVRALSNISAASSACR